jgi:hypothetical protein
MVPGRSAIASTVGVAESFGAKNASGSATLSASPSAATTVGDLLVATIRSRNVSALAPVSSVTDSNVSDHWTRAAGVTQGSQADGEVWYAASAASLATSQAVTVTVGGTSAATSAIAFTVLDVTGAATSPLDVTATKSGSAAPVSTGITPTTTQASEIAIGDIGWNSSVTPSAQTAGYSITAVEQSTDPDHHRRAELLGHSELHNGRVDRGHRHVQAGEPDAPADDQQLQPDIRHRRYRGHDHRDPFHRCHSRDLQRHDRELHVYG